jgi:hypothetical protein
MSRKDEARSELFLISELCCSMYLLCRLCCSMYCVCVYVCKCVLYYCHRVSTQLHLNILYSFLLIVISPTHCRCEGLLLNVNTLIHTTFSRSPLDKGSARRRDLYFTTRSPSKRAAADLSLRFLFHERFLTVLPEMRWFKWTYFLERSLLFPQRRCQGHGAANAV